MLLTEGMKMKHIDGTCIINDQTEGDLAHGIILYFME